MPDILLQILRYAVMLLGITLFTYFLKTTKYKRDVKPIFIIILLILASSFIPMIKIGNKNYSILNFILEGSSPFLFMIVGYSLSLLLLLLKRRSLDHAAFFIHIVAIVFGFMGLNRHIPSYAINDNKIPGLLWVFWYTVLPIPTSLFYLKFLDDDIYNKSKTQ